MPSYSCLSCRVSFIDSELQRSHYKSNWHRYNLKRKVAELPPVTEDVFQQKLTQQKSDAEEQKKDTTKFCERCSKSFTNENAYTNHINSKKHKAVEEQHGTTPGTALSSTDKENVKSEATKTKRKRTNKTVESTPSEVPVEAVNHSEDDEDDDDWEDVEDNDEEMDEDEEGTEAIPSNKCLFCPHESLSFEESLHHMTRSHSFFIPDIDFVTELENFIIYLGAKVGDGKICLNCNKKSRIFQTVVDVQKHMRDKGHCLVDYEGENALEYSDFYDFSTSYPDFDPDKAVAGEDQELDKGRLQVDEDTMELILPSGARAGHRALKHVYNQGLPPAHLQFNRERAMIKGLNAEYKSLGWCGAVSASTRKHMIAFKAKIQADHKSRMRLGVKANKFQPHFRAQIRF